MLGFNRASNSVTLLDCMKSGSSKGQPKRVFFVGERSIVALEANGEHSGASDTWVPRATVDRALQVASTNADQAFVILRGVSVSKSFARSFR
eukprot:s788_g10.t1